MTQICLCADDYGLAPGVSAAIRELAEKGLVCAASAMTVWPSWAEDGARLRGWPKPMQWGLHITLTDAAPLGPMPRLAPSGRLPPLSRLLARSVSTGLPRAEVREEIARQLDAFQSATGHPPRFLDGHQHVHVLSGVREEVLALFDDRLDRGTTWLRVCTSDPRAIWRRGVSRRRALLIHRLSGPLAGMARERGLVVNDDFRGVTDFDPLTVAAEFEAWLDGAVPRTLLMCHPGRVDETLRARDRVLARRKAELDYLAGPGFTNALARRGLAIAPLTV